MLATHQDCVTNSEEDVALDKSGVAEMMGKTADLDNLIPKTINISGDMEVARPPPSRVGAMKEYYKSGLESAAPYLTHLKPWREFITLSRPTGGDIQPRIRANFFHFRANYAILAGVIVALKMLTDMKCLILTGVLFVCWLAFLKKNSDPDWEVAVGGMQLGKPQRSMGFGAVTAVLMLTVAGYDMLQGMLASFILAALHGVLHAIPDGAATEEAGAAPVFVIEDALV